MRLVALATFETQPPNLIYEYFDWLLLGTSVRPSSTEVYFQSMFGTVYVWHDYLATVCNHALVL